MKITFVGTSHGVPAADRFCSCIMLESGTSLYFIDAGAPVIDSIHRHGRNVNDLRAVFTTHVHSDHTVGLLHLTSLMHWYYKDSAADFYIAEQEHIETIKKWCRTADGGELNSERIRFHVPTEGPVYEDENIKVEYIRTKHLKNSYAILVTEGSKRVLFSGDLSWKLLEADVPVQIREELDAFVCEMAHFGVELISPYLAECRAKRVLFTHVFPLDKYGDIEKIKGDYPFEILTPADGDSYEI